MGCVSANFKKWEQERFEEQMESWLEFVWSNLKNEKYQTYQGLRERFESGANIGKVKTPKSKWGLKTALNSWDLFRDWKAQQKIAYKSFLTYDQAVNEMNIFLDFMKDNYLDFVEY